MEGAGLSFQRAFTVTSPVTVMLSPTLWVCLFTSHPENSLPAGVVKPLEGSLKASPFFAVFSSIFPVPPLPSKLTLYSTSFQMAVTVVSSLTVISSPTWYSFSPIFQPLSSLFSGALNSLEGSLKALPFLTVFLSIVPEPSPGSKLTSTMLSFQMAFTLVSLSTMISVPAATSLPSISQVLNSWFSGAVKVEASSL